MIGLDRHIGEATDRCAQKVQHQKCDVAGDDEAVPDQLAAPTKQELQNRPGVNAVDKRHASGDVQLIPPLRLRLFHRLEVCGRPLLHRLHRIANGNAKCCRAGRRSGSHFDLWCCRLYRVMVR